MISLDLGDLLVLEDISMLGAVFFDRAVGEAEVRKLLGERINLQMFGISGVRKVVSNIGDLQAVSFLFSLEQRFLGFRTGKPPQCLSLRYEVLLQQNSRLHPHGGTTLASLEDLSKAGFNSLTPQLFCGVSVGEAALR